MDEAQTFRTGIARTRGELGRLRHQVALVRLGLLHRRHLRKYNPDQPRVPAGNPDGGRWTGSGGFYSAGLSRGGPNIPRQRPPTSRDRNKAIKAVAKWLLEKGTALAEVIANYSWLAEGAPYISAYLDAPKSLAELHELAQSPARGYDVHHIVEQTAAERDGYPKHLIDRDDNLVRISTLRHWEINAWYQTRNERYDGMSPREYLRGKDWDERRRVGLEALITYGVLRP